MANNLLELSLNLPFVEEQWQRFTRDPQSVDPSWRALFDGQQAPGGNGAAAAHRGDLGAALAEAAAAHPAPIEARPAALDATTAERYARVYALVNAYRVRGHLEAELDPLDHLPRTHHSDLEP